MEILPPAELQPFAVLFDKSELNRALPQGLLRFVGNLGFPEPPEERPWVYANFVQSLDGLVSFGGRRHSGGWIAQSRHDRWMMDLLRAHADAVLCGAQSLRLETLAGPIPRGPVYRIVHPELARYRSECLAKRKLIIVIVTGSGRLRPGDHRLFDSAEVEAWIATTPEGRERLGDTGKTRVLVSGHGKAPDLGELLRRLRRKDGIGHLLTEGGPTLYGESGARRLGGREVHHRRATGDRSRHPGGTGNSGMGIPERHHHPPDQLRRNRLHRGRRTLVSLDQLPPGRRPRTEPLPDCLSAKAAAIEAGPATKYPPL